jgi:hypothetical protein
MTQQNGLPEKFGNWEELPGGGRRYWYQVFGLRSIAAETRLPRLDFASAHEKYPVDTGHRKAQTP